MIVTALFVSVIQGAGYAIAGRIPDVDLRTMLLPLFGSQGLLPWREFFGFLTPLHDSAGRLLDAPLAVSCLVGGAAMIALSAGE